MEVTDYPRILGITLSNDPTLPEYAKYFFNLGMAVAGILAALTIIFGGIYWLVSFGRGQFTDEGKEWMKAGALGLLIIMSSYLIAYTINPALVYFDLRGLPVLSYIFGPLPDKEPGVPIELFNEIPLGTFTEKLLAEKMAGYFYDCAGNPVPGEMVAGAETFLPGPTNLNGDAFLGGSDDLEAMRDTMDGILKKAQQMDELSDALSALMIGGCSCAGGTIAVWPDGKCDPANNPVGSCQICWNRAQFQNCQCADSEGPTGGPTSTSQVCQEGLLEQIEHGPVKMVLNTSDQKCNEKKVFAGLDEFRKRDGMAEGAVTKVTVTDEEGRKEKKIIFINKEKFNQLRLVEQLEVLRNELKRQLEEFAAKAGQLEGAKTSMAQCYLIKPYIEYLENFEQTDQDDKIIMKKPMSEDDIMKYCQNYGNLEEIKETKPKDPPAKQPDPKENSQCMTACSVICPISEGEGLECIMKAPVCKKDDAKCLKDRQIYLDNCLALIECKENELGAKNFSECFDACQNKCGFDCLKKFSPAVDFEKAVKDYEKCLKDGFRNCETDECRQGVPEACFKIALPNCSCSGEMGDCASKCIGKPIDAEALAECVKTSASSCEKIECYNKCPKCEDSNQACIDKQEECRQKCSNLPDCSSSSSAEASQCNTGGKVAETSSPVCLKYLYNDDPLTFYCKQEWWQDPREKTETPLGKERVCPTNNPDKEIPVGTTVDDSLNWARDVSSLAGEAKAKTDSLLKYIDNIAKETGYCKCDSTCGPSAGPPGETACLAHCGCEIVSCKEGDANCVCVLSNPLDPASPKICRARVCARQDCGGNPCQKMINRLSGKSRSDDCPYGVTVGFEGIHKKMVDILDAMDAFDGAKPELKKRRLIYLRELLLSRSRMNDASIARNNYGKDSAIALPCERVEDEIIPPIKESVIEFKIQEKKASDDGKDNRKKASVAKHCYGRAAGEIAGSSVMLTENWFFCEKRK